MNLVVEDMAEVKVKVKVGQVYNTTKLEVGKSRVKAVMTAEPSTSRSLCSKVEGGGRVN